MVAIVRRSAQLIGIRIDPDGANEIARRARGTPRIANRLLRRVRDFAAVEGDGSIDGEIAASSLERLAVDHAGWTRWTRAYLAGDLRAVRRRPGRDRGDRGVARGGARHARGGGGAVPACRSASSRARRAAGAPRRRGSSTWGWSRRARRRAAARAARRAGCSSERSVTLAAGARGVGRLVDWRGRRVSAGLASGAEPGEAGHGSARRSPLAAARGQRRGCGRDEEAAGGGGGSAGRADRDGGGGLEHRRARLHRAGGVRRVPPGAARALAGEPHAAMNRAGRRNAGAGGGRGAPARRRP